MLFIGGAAFLLKNRASNFDYANYGALFIVALAATENGLVFGLLASLIMVFAQISFLVVDYILSGTSIYFTLENLWWLALILAAAFSFGFIGDRLRSMENIFGKHGEEINDMMLTGRLSQFSTGQRFFHDLEYEIARSKRAKSVFLIVLLHLQDLEGIRLRFGKDGLAKVMMQIGMGLLRVARDTDKKGRLDENTVALLLPETPRQNLPIAAQRIIHELKEVIVEYKGERVKYPPIFQISAAAYPEDGDTVAALIAKARDFSQNKYEHAPQNA